MPQDPSPKARVGRYAAWSEAQFQPGRDPLPVLLALSLELEGRDVGPPGDRTAGGHTHAATALWRDSLTLQRLISEKLRVARPGLKDYLLMRVRLREAEAIALWREAWAKDGEEVARQYLSQKASDIKRTETQTPPKESADGLFKAVSTAERANLYARRLLHGTDVRKPTQDAARANVALIAAGVASKKLRAHTWDAVLADRCQRCIDEAAAILDVYDNPDGERARKLARLDSLHPWAADEHAAPQIDDDECIQRIASASPGGDEPALPDEPSPPPSPRGSPLSAEGGGFYEVMWAHWWQCDRGPGDAATPPRLGLVP